MVIIKEIFIDLCFQYMDSWIHQEVGSFQLHKYVVEL